MTRRPHPRPAPTPLANRVAFALHRRLGPLLRRGAADFGIGLDDLYRLDGHWALTFSRLGTIHLPPDQLRRLGAYLDPRSYREVLRRSRPEVGPATIRLVEGSAPDPGPGRQIRVGDDYYGRDHPARAAHYPYVMHPWVYALGRHRRVAAWRGGGRRHRLFFAGVVNDGYAERFDFPMMPRPAVVECVRDTFGAESCVVTRRADLAALRRTDRPIVLILFGGDVTPMASGHFLGRARYARLLARSEFALCPPGVFMPHAHNLVEALAVGTVPVLNYAGFCRPPLTPGVDCLAFRTPADLVAAVRRALAAPPAEVRGMRQAAAALYDAHLSPAGAARDLARWLAGHDLDAGPAPLLLLNREFNAARAWSRARAARPG